MTADVDARLTEIMARKAAAERAAIEDREKKARAEADRSAAKDVARSLWEGHSLPMISRVVENMNRTMKSAGIELKIVDEKPESPAISRLQLWLLLDGHETNKRLVFNVNAFGSLHLVQLIPHSGPAKSSEIEWLDESSLKDFIVDFLDIAIEKPK